MIMSSKVVLEKRSQILSYRNAQIRVDDVAPNGYARPVDRPS